MDELDSAIFAARKAGKKIMEFYLRAYSVEYKADDSPVTSADIASEKIIMDELKGFGYRIWSEESGMAGDDKKVWVVDPLDGTKDFIEKTGEFSVMIGLLHKNKPVLGVVYAPALDKLYHAAAGKGAFLGNKMINVSNRELKDFRLVLSRHHTRKEDMDAGARLGIRDFAKVGSVGVKCGLISEGDAELCVYTTDFLKAWDCAAPHMILLEAGGDVYDKEGNEIDYSSERMKNGFIGSNGKFKAEILKAISKEHQEKH